MVQQVFGNLNKHRVNLKRDDERGCKMWTLLVEAASSSLSEHVGTFPECTAASGHRHTYLLDKGMLSHRF